MEAAQPRGMGPPTSGSETLPDVPGLILEGLLGRGRQSTVYRARTDDARGKLVAVRVFAPDSRGFARALVAWRKLEALHPTDRNGRLVEALGCGKLPDGGAFLTLAYHPLGSLSGLLHAHGPLPEERALVLAEQLCEALQLLHDGGIIHRDVKPSNALLVSEDRVCLADFGLPLSELPYAGNPDCRAPELRGDGAPCTETRALDIYGLGATLHALLTARPPRPGRPDIFGLELAAVSRASQRLLIELLAPAPADRPASASAVRARLATCRLALVEPPAAEPPPRLTVSTDWCGATRTDQRSPAADSEAGGRFLDAEGTRYVLREEIGRGGMGVVFRALDRTLRREVAVKVMSSQLESRPEALTRFVREAQATGQLQHPGIVPIYDIGRDALGRVFIAMKLVTGRTLKDFLRPVPGVEPASRFQLLELFVDIARSVAFAHERGVVHRDLKPANVMIGDFGEVQVMDWGLAKLLSEHAVEIPGTEFGARLPATATRDGALLGTPAYMAPEQAEDASKATAASDIYSLGVILYELLNGRRLRDDPLHPRQNLQPEEAAAAPVLRLPGVPRELAAICHKALALRPAQRYPTAQALADDVQAHIEGRPVAACPQGMLGRLAKSARRNPRTSLTVISLLSLLALLLLGGFAALSVAFGERSDALRSYRSLADLRRLGMLDAWAAASRRNPDTLALWLSMAEDLALRLPGYRSDLDRLRPKMDAGRTAATGSDAWLIERLGELIVQSETLVERRLPDQRRRAALLAAYEAAWEQVVADVADSSSVYGGLRLPMAADLVPLGKNPHSGLWEFAHLLSGELPRRHTDGTPYIEGGTGLVFVLLPPGSFMMGSDAFIATSIEQPVHEVRLDAFYISKFELTRGQWLRLTGANPSTSEVGQDDPWRYPLESVLASELASGLPAVGLRLPTESQWEYAARGGTASEYWSGDEQSSIVGLENLAGSGSDGPRPVGSYAPNPGVCTMSRGTSASGARVATSATRTLRWTDAVSEPPRPWPSACAGFAAAATSASSLRGRAPQTAATFLPVCPRATPSVAGRPASCGDGPSRPGGQRRRAPRARAIVVWYDRETGAPGVDA